MSSRCPQKFKSVYSRHKSSAKVCHFLFKSYILGLVSHTTPVNIWALDIKLNKAYKYLGVHPRNKLDCTTHTPVLYMKDQSRLHLLRGLGSLSVQDTSKDLLWQRGGFSRALCCLEWGMYRGGQKRPWQAAAENQLILDCCLELTQEGPRCNPS